MLYLCAVLLAAAPVTAPAVPSELAPPVRILAGDKPIDVDVGHAAPCLADLTGDGKPCLLVGQFAGGKLRIYANAGSKERPRFDKFEWLHAGGAAASVPAG